MEPGGNVRAGSNRITLTLWRPMPGGAGDAFTLLTTEPGPDVAPSTIGRWSCSTDQTGGPGSSCRVRRRTYSGRSPLVLWLLSRCAQPLQS